MGEALHKNAVATGEFDLGEKGIRGSETDTPLLDKVSDEAGGMTLSEVTENFCTVQGRPLGERKRAEKRNNERKEERARFHGSVMLDTGRSEVVPSIPLTVIPLSRAINL